VDNGASTSQQQPRVVYVAHDANTGQVHLHPVTSTANGQANADQQQMADKTFIPQIILALVMLLFGCVFGLVALILARKYYLLCSSFHLNDIVLVLRCMIISYYGLVRIATTVTNKDNEYRA